MANKNNEKKTRFATVKVRQYPCVLSDNPGGHYGPSIELGGWYCKTTHDDGSSETVKRLSIFERERVINRRNCFYLSHNKRERMLLRANYTEQDLASAMQSKQAVQRSRYVSNLLQSPATRVSWMFRASKREKKLGRATKNLYKLQGDTFFFSHEEIYGEW